MKFVNRQSEMRYVTSYLSREPNSLLFIYGPKSSGKSTLLDKVVRTLDLKHYAVNFLDLRSVLIYDFQSFLEIFFLKGIKETAKDIIEGISINLGFFALKANQFQRARWMTHLLCRIMYNEHVILSPEKNFAT